MRKSIKKELLVKLNEVERSHELLTSLLDKKKKEELLALLTQEQEYAIQIGSKIEAAAGEGTRAVQILEAYCELVWNISQEEDRKSRKKLAVGLSKLIIQCKKAIQEFEESYDIVFLPYKASMWDCMESVWMAAKEDQTCNCYVIPIPYYDCKNDGTTGTMHYEAEKFPAYVPITHYHDYNISEKHPEIIYIHNPYDAGNKVTRIHPDFYSSKIKAYTDMLVYIPYFLSCGHMPEIHSLLPAYLHVDKIILQNDTMLEDIDPLINKKKLTALGSPKIDKLLELCGNRPELPQSWRNIIYNEDGSKNKVVMYNISVTGLLNLKDKMLRKMAYVFDVVKKMQGVVLLWRPHPLIEATLESMVPEIQKQYACLKERFIKEGIGIYDNTPEPAISIALCDAYIGEASSSIVEMFGVVGKPIFILSDTITDTSQCASKEELMALSIRDMVFGEKTGWFVSNRYQAVCEVDLETGNTEMIARIPETEIKEMNLYGYIYKRENKIYLSPLQAEGICIFNLKNKGFKKLYFPDRRGSHYIDLDFYEDEVILKPWQANGIGRYHEALEEVHFCDGFMGEYQSHCTQYDMSQPAFVGRIKRIGDNIWLPCAQCNGVIRYNLRDDSFEYYEVGSKKNTYNDIEIIEDEAWLLPYHSEKIVKWNLVTKQYEEYDCYLEWVNRSGREVVQLFGWWYKKENKLYAIPIQGECMVEINLEANTFKPIEIKGKHNIWDRQFKHGKSWGNIEMVRENEDELYLMLAYDESLIVLDKEDMSIKREIKVRLSDMSYKDIQEELFEGKMNFQDGYQIAYEDKEYYSLTNYLEYIKNRSGDRSVNSYRFQEKNAGNRIHEYIKAQ